MCFSCSQSVSHYLPFPWLLRPHKGMENRSNAPIQIPTGMTFATFGSWFKCGFRSRENLELGLPRTDSFYLFDTGIPTMRASKKRCRFLVEKTVCTLPWDFNHRKKILSKLIVGMKSLYYITCTYGCVSTYKWNIMELHLQIGTWPHAWATCGIAPIIHKHSNTEHIAKPKPAKQFNQ